MRPMLIFDAHLDLAWNALDWNRDLRLPVSDIRRREREQGLTEKGRGVNTVSFVELRRGQVGVFIATLLPRLLPPGRPLLREMERVGMILDVTHLSDQCFDEALEGYGGPVLASHHNCRALVPDQRQLTDEQIRRLIARRAVIGAALDDWMLV